MLKVAPQSFVLDARDVLEGLLDRSLIASLNPQSFFDGVDVSDLLWDHDFYRDTCRQRPLLSAAYYSDQSKLLDISITTRDNH